MFVYKTQIQVRAFLIGLLDSVSVAHSHFTRLMSLIIHNNKAEA